jgi:4-hydroxybenzoate polyprenyltransferase
MTALAYAIFAILAAHGRPSLRILAITTAGMIALQFAISALNDYRDRDADRYSRKFKPIARGIVPGWAALVATAILTALMILCYAPFGITPLLIASAFLVLGFAYDLGLKSTPLGAVLMGLAFPLLPLLAWDLFASLKPALFWTFPLGLAIGASIHIADALPDLAADKAAGGHTLTLTLGDAAQGVQWALLAGASLLVVALALDGMTQIQPVALTIATATSFALIAASFFISRRSDWSASRRLLANFILTVLTSLVIAVGWVVSALL